MDDFAGHILRVLNFDNEGRLIASKRAVLHNVCYPCVAKADTTVVDNADCSLICRKTDCVTLELTTMIDEHHNWSLKHLSDS